MQSNNILDLPPEFRNYSTLKCTNYTLRELTKILNIQDYLKWGKIILKKIHAL
jgi:hypothetical protein